MKKLQRIGLFLCLLFLGVICSPAKITEASGGYEISSYHTDIMVMEDNKIYVHEKLNVNFTEERHGIIRFVPERFSYRGEDGKVYMYKTKISNLSVEGDPYTVESDGDYQKIQIGDEDKTVTGDRTYILSYTIDVGEDRIPEYDMLYLDLLGADNDCVVEKADFTITFEKPADMEKIQFYCGEVGTTDASGVTYQIADGKVTGSTARALKEGEALTVFLKLPADYYSGARTYKPFLMMIGILLLLGVTAAALFLFLKTRGQRHVVSTVEFYPPEGMTSAEVGYIIDGVAGEEDVVSLFIWLADQGYLRISGEGKDMTFTKVREMEKSMPHYLKVFYRGLFRKRESVTMKELTKDFYESYTSTLSCLKDHFSGKRRLSDTRVSAAGWGLIAGAAITTFMGLMGCGGTVDSRLFLYSVLSGIILAGGGYILNYMWHQHIFGKKSHMMAVYGSMAGLYGIVALLFVMRNTFFVNIFPVMILLTGFIAVLVAAATYKFTDYKIEVSGKLLGLRQFIETAELDRLEMLVCDNPEYFYHILPYAYVFGLTDKWIKQFEEIAVEPPLWYYGNYDASMYSFMIYRMVHDLQDGCRGGIRKMQEEHAAKMAESSAGGSGGGFSGGGAGGGGTSSW